MLEMRRLLRLLAVLLLCGCGSTFAVAWCLSHFKAEGDYGKPVAYGGLATPSGEWLDFKVYERIGCAQARWDAGLRHPALTPSRALRERPAPAWSAVSEHPAFRGPAPRATYGQWIETAVGWPCLALRWTRTSRSPLEWPSRRLAYSAFGLGELRPLPPRRFARPWELKRAFPIVPIWSGFILNSLLAALAIWLVVCGPRRLRQYARVRANKCLACGYPAGMSPRCSECGNRFSGRPVADQTP